MLLFIGGRRQKTEGKETKRKQKEVETVTEMGNIEEPGRGKKRKQQDRKEKHGEGREETLRRRQK